MPSTPPNPFFTPFDVPIEGYALPERFTYPFDYTPHPLCLLAAKQLQTYLNTQQDWEHNFGLEQNKEGTIIGKMFGVLLVRASNGEIGFLAAFSGKLAGSNVHNKFVPPVFDMLTEGSFLNTGMVALTHINQEIKSLELADRTRNKTAIETLKQQRRDNSIALQNKLFDQYHFLNQAGTSKSLRQIFQETLNTNPPSAAGECAAPKLLQYAFQHEMQPLALAEFWWGLSPKSDYWQHGQFYPACKEKCEPILSHMLSGMAMDEPPIRPTALLP